MKLQGAPRISSSNWKTPQAIDLKSIWDDITRVVNTNDILFALWDVTTQAQNTHTGSFDTLDSEIVGASQMANLGDKVEFEYAGILAGASTCTRTIKVQFAGSDIFTTGGFTIGGSPPYSWNLRGTIIRIDSGDARATVIFTSSALASPIVSSTALVSMLDFTTPLAVTLLAESSSTGAMAGDIVMYFGWGKYYRANLG